MFPYSFLYFSRIFDSDCQHVKELYIQVNLNYKLVYRELNSITCHQAYYLIAIKKISELFVCSRKEVFQPHLPVRLPCYDLAPVTSFTLGRSLRLRTLGTPNFHGLTGGVYKARERIHRIIADIRLLANPASRSRVADSYPN